MAQALVRTRVHHMLERRLSGELFDYRQIIALFLPILIDQAFIVGLNLINTAMISSSGVAAVSAVNMIDSLNFFLIFIFIAVSTGGTVLVAQFKGSGNPQMVTRAAASTVSTVALFAAAIGLLMIAFHTPTLNALFGSASEDVLANGRTYLIGSCTSYLGIAIFEAVCGALRGIGRSRPSLFLSLIMNFSFVLLNFVFINLLDMGVLGLTIAMNTARYLGAACAIYYLVRIDSELRFRIRDAFYVNLAMVRKIMSTGLPFAAEQIFFNGGKLLTQVFVVSMGTYALATNAISSTFAAVYQVPANALSIVTITVIGQCMGARNIRDARKYTKSFLGLSSMFFIVMALVMLPLFYPIVQLFHPPAEIVDDIFTITLINAVAQIPLWGISFLMPSALRAAGDSKFTSIVSLLSMWLFRIVLGYVLGIVLDFGIIGVWMAMNCEWGVRGLIFLLRFRGEKWYRKRLID
ncbi:MATE family efflux transporter [Cohnella lubricantis]|uniref:Probable multidrug resistance protein NorM n=1 Tax=Cohnella lubricantis TaxID=2163172 RepID=A0A841THY4_9BACL|nr:MATE family efflux transporter [Cohnella lubricantis]MBB6678557.1 MATE family efflux transporter [Cohnella lubricantis]MBP2119134.1 putative MATE family efflux protein [Cohnella lubricantis]